MFGFETPVDPALEEPMLPPVELSGPYEGELEPAFGKLLDSPASDFEDTPETLGVPKYEVPVEKPFALPVGAGGTPEFRGWEGETGFVGVE